MKAQMQPTALKSVTGLQQAATGSNRHRQEQV